MRAKTYTIGIHSFTADDLAPGLYLVPTPIGNLADVTLRSLQVLAAADVVYCEDTRVTPRLFERFGIKARLKPYHDYNAATAGRVIVAHIIGGASVALVSDAGTPLLSDPGFPLVRDCLAAGLKVEALPGASALLPALQLSGLPSERFTFLGFLPQKKQERLTWLAEIAARPETVVVYESPRRIIEALEDMDHAFPDRALSVSREISKRHEETLRGTARAIVETLKARPAMRGECVVVIGTGSKPKTTPSSEELDTHIALALKDHPAGKAASRVAKKLGLPRQDVYARILAMKGQS